MVTLPSASVFVGGNDTYGITGIPSTVGGCGVVQRAGLEVSTRIVYPGSGREDAYYFRVMRNHVLEIMLLDNDEPTSYGEAMVGRIPMNGSGP